MQKKPQDAGYKSLFIPTKEMIIQCLESHGINYKYDSGKRNVLINAPWEDEHDYKLYIYIGENNVKVTRGAWNHFRSKKQSRDFIHLYQDIIGEKDYNKAKFDFVEKFLGITDLKGYFKNVKKEAKEVEKEKVTFNFPAHFRKILDTDLEYIQYLEDRKIDWRKYKIYVNELERRIVFPMYVEGNLVSYSQRAIDNDPKIERWKHAFKKEGDDSVVMFGLDSCSLRAYIFEGITDAMSFNRSSIGMMKAVISQAQIEKMVKHGIKTVYYVGDNDATGKDVRSANLNALNQHFETYYYDWEESGYSGKDEKDFADIKKKYGEVRTEGLFKRYNKLVFELKEKVLNV